MIPASHPFAGYRAVTIALRRPLSRILGTDAARIAEMKPQDRSAQTRRQMRRENDPLVQR